MLQCRFNWLIGNWRALVNSRLRKVDFYSELKEGSGDNLHELGNFLTIEFVSCLGVLLNITF